MRASFVPWFPLVLAGIGGFVSWFRTLPAVVGLALVVACGSVQAEGDEDKAGDAADGDEVGGDDDDGPLTEEQFQEAFGLKACETCETWCGLDTGGYDDEHACEFDPAMAQACLDAEWTCTYLEPADVEVPELPASCESVYIC